MQVMFVADSVAMSQILPSIITLFPEAAKPEPVMVMEVPPPVPPLAGLTVAGQRLVLASLGCGGGCQSCGLTLTESLREVLVTFNRKYITQTTPGNIQEDLRTDLLHLVGLYNQLSREIFKKSSLEEKVGDCDRQKAKVWEKLK